MIIPLLERMSPQDDDELLGRRESEGKRELQSLLDEREREKHHMIRLLTTKD